METITRKPIIKEQLTKCLSAYETGSTIDCSAALYQHLLLKKIKFPLLEFCGHELFKNIPFHDLLSLCDHIAERRTIGGNVIIGIILQERMKTDSIGSMAEACKHIEAGNEWYVTDIIGERIFGVGLLEQTKQTMDFLHQIKHHHSNWVVRSIGPGVHYATKKGLSQPAVETAFQLLMELAKATDYHIKTGIGWAAKTIAKFHPEIIEKYKEPLSDPDKTGKWFNYKIKIGLERHAYAKRN